ncbi:MAG: YfjI family protein, partial [Kiritimatiellota bacterium]|nr:YfjI family protein [Kiritimatiellota bacterium]
GSRKSDTFRACLAPVENFEIELAQQAKPAIARAAERRAIEEARLTEIRKRAGRCDDIQERQKLTIEAEELAANLTEIPIPPRMIAGDISPEHLASLLCANGGRMAVADAEGGLIFEIMAGRYTKNGGPNIEIFLKGHAGDAVRVDRSGRPSEFARTAALTCILTAQPAILRNLAAKDQLRGRGLLARFLFTMPSGLIGERAYANKPMDAQLVGQYAASLYDLLSVPPLDPDEPEAHRRLNLDGEALEIWRTYHDRIEKDQAPDGELSHMTDFASKLPGAVARMAGILHLMKHGPHAPKDIEPDTAAGAWALGLFFLEHTKAAFAEMGAGGDMGLARRVYSWISRNSPERFTLGRLFDDLRRGAGLDLSDDLLP